MRQSTASFLLLVLVSQVYTAPQLISFNEGKLGVNFGGYHAAVGLGGALGSGAGGGLFAEAGTPHGQAARAGLGGAVDGSGGSAGGLYAGATAGGNVKASAGIGGGVTAEKSAGAGYASAQAGDRFASSGLGGESSVEGSSGFSFSGSKSFGISSGVVKDVNVQPVKTVEVAVQPVDTVAYVTPIYKEVRTEIKPVYKEVYTEVKPVYKEIHTEIKPVEKVVHTEIKAEVANEVNPLPLATAARTNVEAQSNIAAGFNVETEVQPAVIYKEVYVQPPPRKVVHKQIVRTHYKPHRHHYRKHAYFGGYVGGGGVDFIPPPPPPPPPAPVVVYKTVQPVVYKSVQPVIEKRVDVGVAGDFNAGAAAQGDVNLAGGGGAQYGYTKQVTIQRNPNFFADIFNIPISTLRAVGNFLGNTAGSTSVSVQKSASIQADSDSESSKHVPSSSSTSSETHVSVQTPPVSKFIDDILAIPINTLGAVNKFLENNVPARKNIQVSPDGETTKVRLGPHARRRANKRVVVLQESSEPSESEKVLE